MATAGPALARAVLLIATTACTEQRATVPDAGPEECDAAPTDAFAPDEDGASVAPDAGPPPECVADEECATLLCVDGRCTQTCRDECDCNSGQRCGDSSHTVPVCVEGAGACAPERPSCAAPTWSSTAFRNELNQDFADYGLFLSDALEPACAEEARDRLAAKLEATLAATSRTETLGRTVGPFQGWLEGADVFMIFAAAAVLGGRGLLTDRLDALLERVRDSYLASPTFIGLDPGCGIGEGRWRGGNACMDDYTVAAPAYGWLAAYERLRRRPHADFVETTRDLIAASFGEDALCVHDPTRPMDVATRGPCNASVSDLGTGSVQVVSLNHGAQNIAYGLGLMTLVGSAVVALEIAGVSHVPTATEHAAAMGLLEEGQRSAEPDGSAFRTDCLRFVESDGAVITLRDADCGDVGLHYLPRMFYVEPIYSRYYAPPPAMVNGAPAYRFDTFDPALFSDSPDWFFNPGRRLTYGTTGEAWLSRRPPMSGVIH